MGIRDTGGVSSNTSETVGVVTVITIVRFGFSGTLANTLRGEVCHAFANFSKVGGILTWGDLWVYEVAPPG